MYTVESLKDLTSRKHNELKSKQRGNDDTTVFFSLFFFLGWGGGGGGGEGGHQKSNKSRMLSTLSLFCANFSAVGYAGIILFAFATHRHV